MSPFVLICKVWTLPKHTRHISFLRSKSERHLETTLFIVIKMKTRLKILPLLSLLFLFSCDSNTLEDEVPELMVIQAYLYAGEPVTDIHVTATLSFGSDDTTAPPINDAIIRLFKEDLMYQLVLTDENGYYHYPGEDLTVEPNDHFRIEVMALGTTATGETIVPPPPTDVTLSETVLEAPNFDFRGFPGGGLFPEESSLILSWENPNNLLHYVVIDGLEDDAETITPDFFSMRIGRFRFITQPTEDASYRINVMMLEHLGRHRAKVYRVNKEYADLYENREQDSRDLNEPPDNIIGGLGVFSAFNSDEVFFEVVRAASGKR